MRISRAPTARSPPWAAFQPGRRVEPAQLPAKGRNGLALGGWAGVLVGPGDVAVATEVAARPVADCPRPLEQPLGQVRQQEHGQQGGQADPGRGRVRHASSFGPEHKDRHCRTATSVAWITVGACPPAPTRSDATKRGGSAIAWIPEPRSCQEGLLRLGLAVWPAATSGGQQTAAADGQPGRSAGSRRSSGRAACYGRDVARGWRSCATRSSRSARHRSSPGLRIEADHATDHLGHAGGKVARADGAVPQSAGFRVGVRRSVGAVRAPGESPLARPARSAPP